MNFKKFLVGGVAGVLMLGALSVAAFAAQPTNKGFDQFGYNRTARIFNGTGESWALEQGLPANYLGIYAPDKLVMKWNAEWDRGNAENWSNPPYAAWEDNEWNGKALGGSGYSEHYKTVWSPVCAAGGTLTDGGYCIWGQFEVIFDQGSSLDNSHVWYTHANPSGYGVYFK